MRLKDFVSVFFSTITSAHNAQKWEETKMRMDYIKTCLKKTRILFFIHTINEK